MAFKVRNSLNVRSELSGISGYMNILNIENGTDLNPTGPTGTTGPTGAGFGTANLYTVNTINIFGDSLSARSNTGSTWETSFNEYYGTGPNGTGQVSAINNNAVGGSQIAMMTDKVYSSDLSGDTILWGGVNDLNAIASFPVLRGVIMGYVALGVFSIFNPSIFNLSAPGVTFNGVWSNTELALPWGGRGVFTTSSTATITIPVNTRYVYVQCLLSGTVVNNLLTYYIDGTESLPIVQQTTRQIAIPNPGTLYYPYDMFIDRGVSKIGVSTNLILGPLSTAAAGFSFRVIGYSAVDTLPTKRATIIGPWMPPYLGVHTAGGPDRNAGINNCFRGVIEGYRAKGLDVRYLNPPIPMFADFIGEGTITIHPSVQYNNNFGRLIGRVALAPNSSVLAQTELTSAIPSFPTFYSPLQ